MSIENPGYIPPEAKGKERITPEEEKSFYDMLLHSSLRITADLTKKGLTEKQINDLWGKVKLSDLVGPKPKSDWPESKLDDKDIKVRPSVRI